MFRYCIISIFLCATVTVANAQDFSLADSLMRAADYERAAVEYERCHYLATQADQATAALRHKAECYKRMARYERAAATLERYAQSYGDYLQIALCHYMGEAFPKTVETCENARLLFDTVTADLLLLQTLALNELYLYDSAHAVAQRLVTLLPATDDRLRDTVDALYAQSPKLKSETTARWLSLCPGLGHLYAGYLLEAATAAAINAAAMGFGVWQVLEHCYITAYIGGAGLLSATWPGAMQSAEIHARKTNQRRTAEFNRHCRERLIDSF